MAHSVHTVLAGHHDNPAYFRQRIETTLTQLPDGELAIVYVIHGIDSGLRIPTPEAPAPDDALWRTTCCELFVNPVGLRSYREFNFSPSGQWAIYDFLDTRTASTSNPGCAAPEIKTKRAGDTLQLDVTLPKSAFPRGECLRLAVDVILETSDHRFGYWALTHPPGKPDFHQRGSFVLSLDARGFRVSAPSFS